MRLPLLALLSLALTAGGQNNVLPLVNVTKNIRYVESGSLLTAFNTLPVSNCVLELGSVPFTVPPSNNVSYIDSYAPLLVVGKTNLLIRGNRTKIFGAGPGTFMVVSNCQDLTIEGIRFQGDRTGFASNGISGIHYGVLLVGTNNRVTIRNCHFDSLSGYGIGAVFDPLQGHQQNFLTIEGCSAFNCGTTNTTVSGRDGGFFAGAANGLRILGFSAENVIRAIELFAVNVAPTNQLIESGQIRGHVYDGILTSGAMSGIRVANVQIRGPTPIEMNPPGAQTRVGFTVQDDASNVTFDGCDVQNARSVGWTLTCGSGSISNVHILNCKAQNIGWAATLGEGVNINDQLGGGIIDGVYIRNLRVTDTLAGDGVHILGGRNIYIEHSTFTDIGDDSFRVGVRTSTGADPISNIVVRANHFQNYGSAASRMQHAALFHSGCMDCRFEENTATNLAVGVISDASASSTIVGRRYSYSVQTNLASLAAGAATTIFIPAVMARTNWVATPMIPGNFFGASGGGDIAITSFCTNALICIRVVNNGAGAFDAPDTRIRAYCNAIEAY